ncbi:sensor histidine kinase KdpD [Ferruginibacter sp. HRS2-29]|uniref:sensor histidine kinase n=1 Tax=Ferruginibacter sp. HRS2-29 TaxID=2487334 RepID=UPI0020CF2BC4|nr:HAMP domain-containing sensor histidine kinase [Ferruginibacter sp. HRS2-29]MCP9750883.1 sensor histidine kinase [Ferruginibacter sp. HRS2-29]
MFLIKGIKKIRSRIMHIGVHHGLDVLTIRKLYIFNQLNFLGFLTGIIIPLAALSGDGYLPVLAWFVASSPAAISLAVLISNHYRRYEQAMLIYFIFYPLTTALVYVGNIDVGIELFFILYGVLSVFFLQKIRSVFIAFFLSAACYFMTYIVVKDYHYRMADINFAFYFFNHLLAIIFIFTGLFMIKRENSSYEKRILWRNKKLKESHLKNAQQKELIQQKAIQLENKTAELTELNSLKDRLFSIISHDLKTPIYSLRNLFSSIATYDLPGEEIKVLVPDIISDLNYTTGLMENLLQWAKSQMTGYSVNMELLEVEPMIEEVKQLLRLQAETKNIYVTSKMDDTVYIYADKDMMKLVLRNLVSNAIKFTPEKGEVCIGATQHSSGVELFVKDTGMGISSDAVSKLFGGDFYSTKGTANESGTGLGLFLCKEFVVKNGGSIRVESKPGKGSKFICDLPTP